MKWIEIIELRSTNQCLETLEKELKELCSEIEFEADRISVRAFRHPAYKTDISIHLQHDNEKYSVYGSLLGLKIKEILKEYGFVNHNVWLEYETDNNQLNKCEEK